jgi:hypothetical protein
MSLVCPTCSRVNPPEAHYCHADGTALKNGRSSHVEATRSDFPFPFVFPSGRTCKSFDELALACHDEWDVARALLKHGDLTSFLGGLGRGDLAQAAREAARSADLDAGLDHLIAAMPAKSVDAAKLQVEPTRVNLGTLRPGEDARFSLRLANQGMRLLTGSVTAYSVWLTLGEGEGAASKIFQFAREAVIPVRVRGKALRAGVKPLEGKLVVESSGGEKTVFVRCEVPARPFPDGVLAGAVTPRQIAEKAKANPKVAAQHFESGAVANWYRSNGWDYPVQGPTGSGVGAIQQFFEALGLTTPPKIEISEETVFFIGDPGDNLRHSLEIVAKEKRPVYAHAVSNQPWLEVSRVTTGGRRAEIRLAVPAVPNRPGELLHAKLTVTGNGNQRFVVPVTLAVGGLSRAGRANAVPALPLAVQAVEVPMAEVAQPTEVVEAVVPVAGTRPRTGRMLATLLPLALVGLGLLTAFVHDLFGSRPASGSSPAPARHAPRALISVRFHDEEMPVQLGEGGVKPGADAREGPTQEAVWEPSMRFGLATLGEGGAGGRPKRLTFHENGETNNTCVKLDGHEWLFGERPFRRPNGRYVGNWPGEWLSRGKPTPDPDGGPGMHCRSVWLYETQRIEITQAVSLVAGEQSGDLDTALVRYRIENKDRRSHRVGLRFLLDTFIGDNDGVPFLIPGESRLCDTKLDLRGADVPQYLQACERDDLANPGTVARLLLRPGGGIDPPDRVTLGAWPNPQLMGIDPHCKQEKTLWDVPVLPIRALPDQPDSAVTIYWDARPLEPGNYREVGFAYGLGNVAGSEGGGQLAVSVGGSFAPGRELTVTALVHDPTPGQEVTLELPEGFRLNGPATQRVPPLPADGSSRNSPVNWSVTAPQQTGTFELTVRSSNNAAQSQRVTIRSGGIFGG